MSTFDDRKKASEAGKKSRGGGRKSLREELYDIEWHNKVWNGEVNVEELEKKVKSKKYAGRDAVALRLLKGDAKIGGKFMDKTMPEPTKEHEHSGTVIIQLQQYGHEDPIQLATRETPATDIEESGEVQSDCMASESAQDDVGNQ